MPNARPDAIRPVLIEALSLALGDVDTERQVASVECAFIPGGDGAGSWNVFLSSDDGRGFSGFGVIVDGVGQYELLVQIADQLQDHLANDLDSASYRPPCGTHDHPAVARCLDDEPRWCCRAGCEMWSARIGSHGAVPKLVPAPYATPLHHRVRVLWD